jgi:hypothetical protein
LSDRLPPSGAAKGGSPPQLGCQRPLLAIVASVAPALAAHDDVDRDDAEQDEPGDPLGRAGRAHQGVDDDDGAEGDGDQFTQ